MNKKRKLIYFIPLTLMVLLIAYAINDVLTSRQAGFKDVDRGAIYGLLGIIISLLFIYNIYTSTRKIWKSSFSHSLWMMLIWISFVDIFQSANFWYATIHISLAFWWIMAYYFFYNYLSRWPQSKNFILFTFLIMYALATGINFFIRTNIAKTYGHEFVITGYAYMILLFVPFISLIANNKLKVTLWISAIILTVTSFKRGAIIILPLMFFAYQLSSAYMNKSWNRTFKISLLLGVLMFGAFIYADTASGNYLSSRFSQVELEDGSGRVKIWSLALSNISQRNLLELLIGTGSGSSVKLLGTGAHNEWIEFLFSFGVVGVMFYFYMCMVLVKKYLSMLKLKSYYTPHLSMMVIYVLMVGLFGGFYFVHNSFYAFAFIGFIDFLVKSKHIEYIARIK